MAFSGWNDAAESATTAARYLSQLWPSRTIASIDPEEFYHFGLSRPYVRFKPDSETEREIIWPATEFSLTQSRNLDRDLDRRRRHRAASQVAHLLRVRARAGPARRRLARADARRPARRGAPHAARAPLGQRLRSRARRAARRPLDPVRGTDGDRRRPEYGLPRGGNPDGEPLGQRAALRLRHREPEGRARARPPRPRAPEYGGRPHRSERGRRVSSSRT